MMLRPAQQTDLIQMNNKNQSCPPMTTSFLSQFKSWAKIWMTSPKKSTPRKRKIIAVDYQETGGHIRSSASRTHPCHSLYISHSQQASLYRLTCQKLRPNHNQPTKLSSLGDIIHVRKIWDHLEWEVYQDLCNTNDYMTPSKRLPFNPDKPSWLYKKKASSKRHTMILNTHNPLPKRKSFASSTIVYISSPQQNNKNVNIKVAPIVQPPHYHNTRITKQDNNNDDDDDDDDVPLGALLQLNSKSSLKNAKFSFKR